jgi:hypothetical protein
MLAHHEAPDIEDPQGWSAGKDRFSRSTAPEARRKQGDAGALF